MKRIFLACILGFISPLYAASEQYTLDDQHTYVLWRINHLGFSTQSGKWYAKGSMELDKQKPENSKVSVTIDLTKIVTGIPELDKHLKDKLFFDTEHYPTATFVSDKVVPLSKTTAKVYGTLTFRGISKPIILKATLNKSGKNPINERMSAGFSATANLKRSEFGMDALPGLGDEVLLDIQAEGYKPDNPEPKKM